MVMWMDFVLDDLVGPVMSLPETWEDALDISCRRMRLGNPSIRNDVNGAIQETGQVQRPARMVGHSSLDSARADMEVGREYRVCESLRQRGEG